MPKTPLCGNRFDRSPISSIAKAAAASTNSDPGGNCFDSVEEGSSDLGKITRMKEKQGILGRISLSTRLSGEEANKITRKKGSKAGASSKRSNKSNNPFQGRGMEKFNEVYSELEAMRAAIAAREGVSTSDVWFTRGTSNDKDWVPVVVGKPSSRVSSPERVFKDPEESTTSSRSLEASAAAALDKGVEEQSPSRLTLKAEQIIYDLQQGARRALKAVTLFVMIVAAVTDVLVALVAGFASSFVAKHLRSFWARFLPLNFTPYHRSDLEFEFPVPPSPVAVCSSCPTSPRQQHEEVESFKASIKSATTSASTPVSPVRPLPTFFNSRGHQASASAANQQQQQQQQQRISDRNKQHNLIQSNSSQQQQLSDGTPIMLIVLVILFSLSIGRLTAALLASMAWFLFPIFKTFAGRTRITGAAAARGAFRKQRSFIK